MANILRQSADIHHAFQKIVQCKDHAERHPLRYSALVPAPRWTPPFLRPLVARTRDRRHATNPANESNGESRLTQLLEHPLPPTWIIIPDVVLRLSATDFAQLDHLIIGEGGIYVVAIKTWQAVVVVQGSTWLRKFKGQWDPVSHNPTHQNLAHMRRLQEWCTTMGLSALVSRIVPAIMLFDVAWLKVNDSPMPIFAESHDLVQWLKLTDASQPPLSTAIRDRLIRLVLLAT